MINKHFTDNIALGSLIISKRKINSRMETPKKSNTTELKLWRNKTLPSLPMKTTSKGLKHENESQTVTSKPSFKKGRPIETIDTSKGSTHDSDTPFIKRSAPRIEEKNTPAENVRPIHHNNSGENL